DFPRLLGIALTVGRNIQAGRAVRDNLRRTADGDEILAALIHIRTQRHLRIDRDMPQLRRLRLAEENDAGAVPEKPDRLRYGTTARGDSGEKHDGVVVEMTLNLLGELKGHTHILDTTPPCPQQLSHQRQQRPDVVRLIRTDGDPVVALLSTDQAPVPDL